MLLQIPTKSPKECANRPATAAEAGSAPFGVVAATNFFKQRHGISWRIWRKCRILVTGGRRLVGVSRFLREGTSLRDQGLPLVWTTVHL